MDRTDHQPTESFQAPPGGSDIPPALAQHPRYKVLRVLGQGGMGTVYLAEHRKMERHVALKAIHPKLLQDGSAVERFHREVKAAAKLHHPNIILAYDADEAGDAPTLHFLAMEYVQGQNLAEYLKTQGKLTVTECCHYARQAALGLQHAYEQGMVHRDIKPHNLWRLPNGHVKILDFGLAKFVRQQTTLEPSDQLTATGMILGTVDYLAPEQAGQSHAADIRADIYSLGCTLYQLLTGQLPFPHGTLGEKLSKHAQETPRSVASFRADVPPGLEAVLARLMAKRPEDRYQTPAEVAAALAPYAGDAVSIASATIAIPLTAPVPAPAVPTRYEALYARRFYLRPPWWELMVCALGILLCLTPYTYVPRGIWGVENYSFGVPNLDPGVLLSNVRENSPAAQLGLREGMIVLEVNGIQVERNNFPQLQRLLTHLQPEGNYRIKVLTNGKQQELMGAVPPASRTAIGYMIWSLFAGLAFVTLALILLMRETTRPSPLWRVALVFLGGLTVVLAVPLSIFGRAWIIAWEGSIWTPAGIGHWTDAFTWHAFLAAGCGIALVLLAIWEIRLRGQRT